MDRRAFREREDSFQSNSRYRQTSYAPRPRSRSPSPSNASLSSRHSNEKSEYSRPARRQPSFGAPQLPREYGYVRQPAGDWRSNRNYPRRSPSPGRRQISRYSPQPPPRDEQGFPVDLSYGEEEATLPARNRDYRQNTPPLPYPPQSPRSYYYSPYRDREQPTRPVYSSPRDGERKAQFSRSPPMPLKTFSETSSPKSVIKSPVLPLIPRTPSQALTFAQAMNGDDGEIEEGEDVDMQPPYIASPVLDGERSVPPNDMQIDEPVSIVDKEVAVETHAESVSQQQHSFGNQPMNGSLLASPIIDTGLRIEGPSHAIVAEMSRQGDVSSSVNDASSAPIEPQMSLFPPQTEQESSEVYAPKQRRPSPSPLPESFTVLLEKVANKYSEDLVKDIATQAKEISAKREAIADITNSPSQPVYFRLLVPKTELKKQRDEVLPFLLKNFEKSKSKRDRHVGELRKEYREWDKHWKRHLKKMEKIHMKHAKKLTVPLSHYYSTNPHGGGSLNNSMSLGYGGPASASFMGVHGHHQHPFALSFHAATEPQTPAGEMGNGYFDENASPFGTSTSSFFGGTIVTTPGGPLSGRPSRRGGPNAAGGFSADAVRSEAEFLEILATLENADMLNPEARAAKSAAVVPDMLPSDDVEALVLRFENDSQRVRNPEDFYGTIASCSGRSDPSTTEWSDEEVEIYCQRYGQFPKQFGKIAAGLEDKTLQQCVLFYYRTKDVIDFRALSERRTKDGRRRKPKVASSNKGTSLIAAMKPAADEEDEGSPPPTARGRPKDLLFDRVFGALQAEEGIGIATSKRIFYGSTKRIEAETQRQKKALARVQAQELAQVEAEAVAGQKLESSMLPSDGTMDAAEALALLTNISRPEALPAISEMDQNYNDVKARAVLPSFSAEKGLAGPTASRKRGGNSSYWSVVEKSEFVRLLAIHGKDWVALSNQIGTKTQVQCRNFFANNRAKLNLDEILLSVDMNGALSLASEVTTLLDQTQPEGTYENLAQRSEATLPPLRSAIDGPRAGLFPAHLSVGADNLQVESRPPTSRASSGHKINDLLNGQEDDTGHSSMEQDWFNADESKNRAELTDEEPDLPMRSESRYLGPEPSHYARPYRQFYEDDVPRPPMHRYPMPFDPYRSRPQWAPSGNPAYAMPPRRAYDDRYYREPMLPFQSYPPIHPSNYRPSSRYHE